MRLLGVLATGLVLLGLPACGAEPPTATPVVIVVTATPAPVPTATPLVLNQAQPAYIKQVVAYPEGSHAIQLYVVLADAGGAPTTGEGVLLLTISQPPSPDPAGKGTVWGEATLYRTERDIHRAMFQLTTVGQGAFGHETLLLPLGRLPYSEFKQPPNAQRATIRAVFTPTGGKALDGDTTIFFDQ